MIQRPVTVSINIPNHNRAGRVSVRDATNRLVCTLDVAFNPQARSLMLLEVKVSQQDIDDALGRLEAIARAAYRGLDFAEERGMIHFYAEINPNMVELAEFALGKGQPIGNSGRVVIVTTIAALKTRMENAIDRMNGTFNNMTAEQRDRINGNLQV